MNINTMYMERAEGLFSHLPGFSPKRRHVTFYVVSPCPGVRFTQQLAKTAAFRSLGLDINDKNYMAPGCLQKFALDSDGFWECAVRTEAMTCFHPSGTCKMGSIKDKSAVVDSKLR